MFTPSQFLDSSNSLILPSSLVTPEQRSQIPSQSLVARKATSPLSPFSSTPSDQTNSPADADEEDPDLVYFPVDVDFSKLRDWRQGKGDDQAGHKGELVKVNNIEVAVFRFGEEVLATQARCPHAGGPLHLGDIEMLPDKSLCVKCPWHKWTFCVARGGAGGLRRNPTRKKLFSGAEDRRQGECVWPLGRGQEGYGVKIYPAVTDRKRRTVKIGFESFDKKSLTEAAF